MVVPSAILLAGSLAQGERFDWVLDHATALRSLEPADDDFADLEPLAAAIGGARVVQLGEQIHGDGATFLARGRVIGFLHQRLGFDVVAFESGLFDCSIAEQRMRAAGADALAAAEEGVFASWTRSEQ